MDEKIGVLAPGAFADVIAVSGDPLRTSKHGEWQFVMKDGKVFKTGQASRSRPVANAVRPQFPAPGQP